MQIEMVDPNILKAAEYNPRKMKKGQHRKLNRSIQEFGFVEPIVANRYPGRENIIIGGHQRLSEAIELGLKEVPVNYISVPLDKEKLLNIALNKIVGEWDDEKLVDLITDLDDTHSDLTLSGFEDAEIRRLLKEDVNEDDIPTEIEKRCQVGDLWQLGKHRLLCGDATKPEDIHLLMNGQKADLVFTDPPYGVNYEKKTNEILGNSRTSSQIASDDLKLPELEQMIRKAFRNIANNLSEKASYYICSPQGGEMGLMMMMMMKEESIPCRHVIIWAKNNAVFSMGRLDYSYKHEPILYGWQNKHEFYWKNEVSLWDIDRPAVSKLHPTMKPVSLCARAIRNSSKTDDIILDTFGGSGSTLIAAEQLGRKCYMLELDPHYCDVILTRWEKWTGNKAEKI